jgi:hypothetical protein
MFHTIVVEKIKTYILHSINFSPRKSCRLWGKVWQYVTARQATDDNITWRMRIACWLSKATDTHTEYEILYLWLLHGKHTYANVPQYQVSHCLSCSINLGAKVSLQTAPCTSYFVTVIASLLWLMKTMVILDYKCTLKKRKLNNYTKTVYPWCPDINSQW